ncbi:hypothetical protein GCM10011344_40320 [Dokdonia pacifica]|uniref:Uncharacterized protein n=1 Tax=Dokdonia pacifica TaxID=1627892 RepID=A0A239A884_9FLAO|nr:hypothetical protein [Dokdonia pacifica]GGG35408.1 hypothetical protein GCM10011344_40320 [Dokdonia pacifica]SNR91652.1 hypothetical protein SAMN06265376_104213 [Dokdonia pacifica]
MYQNKIRLFFQEDSSLEGENWETHMETFVVMLYYAYQIDSVNTRELFKATTSTWEYLASFNLPLNGIEYGTTEGTWAYLPLADLTTVITFISNQLLPILQTEMNNGDRQPLLERWGIEGVNFESYLFQIGDFFSEIVVDTHNEMDEIPVDLYRRFDSLKDFFQLGIDNNQRYLVYKK